MPYLRYIKILCADIFYELVSQLSDKDTLLVSFRLEAALLFFARKDEFKWKTLFVNHAVVLSREKATITYVTFAVVNG